MNVELKCFALAAVLLAPLASALGQTEKAGPELTAIRKVYVTGTKKHEIGWARKHLARHSCLRPTDNIQEADAILDLEPVKYHPAAALADDPDGPVTCRSTEPDGREGYMRRPQWFGRAGPLPERRERKHNVLRVLLRSSGGNERLGAISRVDGSLGSNTCVSALEGRDASLGFQ